MMRRSLEAGTLPRAHSKPCQHPLHAEHSHFECSHVLSQTMTTPDTSEHMST